MSMVTVLRFADVLCCPGGAGGGDHVGSATGHNLLVCHRYDQLVIDTDNNITFGDNYSRCVRVTIATTEKSHSQSRRS